MDTETREAIDQAALMGAALAAFIAMAVGAGRWTVLSSALGVTLALVLIAYVRIPPGTLRVKLLRLLAVSAVGGLDISLVLAYPLQEWLVRPRVGAGCIKASTLPGEVATCVGLASAPGLAVLWVLGGVAVFTIIVFGLPRLATVPAGQRVLSLFAGLKPSVDVPARSRARSAKP